MEVEQRKLEIKCIKGVEVNKRQIYFGEFQESFGIEGIRYC